MYHLKYHYFLGRKRYHLSNGTFLLQLIVEVLIRKKEPYDKWNYMYLARGHGTFYQYTEKYDKNVHKYLSERHVRCLFSSLW